MQGGSQITLPPWRREGWGFKESVGKWKAEPGLILLKDAQSDTQTVQHYHRALLYLHSRCCRITFSFLPSQPPHVIYTCRSVSYSLLFHGYNSCLCCSGFSSRLYMFSYTVCYNSCRCEKLVLLFLTYRFCHCKCFSQLQILHFTIHLCLLDVLHTIDGTVHLLTGVTDFEVK